MERNTLKKLMDLKLLKHYLFQINYLGNNNILFLYDRLKLYIYDYNNCMQMSRY